MGRSFCCFLDAAAPVAQSDKHTRNNNKHFARALSHR